MPRTRPYFHKITGPRLFIAGGLFLYLVFHVWSLGWFPFVHSDEVWLASLTRAMLVEGSVAATEDFFRLTPRFAHALKTLFHLVQMPFVAVAFDHVAVRALSLIAGLFALVFFFRAARNVTGGGRSGRGASGAWAVTTLLAIDLQFLYISHLARQEILLLLVLCIVLGFYFQNTLVTGGPGISFRTAVLTCALVGATLGIHPNAFIVALVTLVLLSLELVADTGTGQRPRSTATRFGILLVYAAVTLAGALPWVALSLWMDAGFVTNYLAFGAEVGVAASPMQRVFGLSNHLQALYHQTGGTYYLPPVRLQLLLFAVTLGCALLFSAGRVIHRLRTGGGRTTGGGKSSASGAMPGTIIVRLAAVQLTVLAGMTIVGKFAPPASVLLWPGGMLLAWAILREAFHATAGLAAFGAGRVVNAARVGLVLSLGVIAVWTVQTGVEVARWRTADYRGYLAQIMEVVPPGSRVLGNLNTNFGFDYGALRVWRDLGRLPDSGLDIAGFLREQRIEYVLYADELDVIFRERPVWNAAYGNLYPWYDQLQAILSRDAELIHSFEAPCYAMRLVSYMCTQPYRLRIYRLPDGVGPGD